MNIGRPEAVILEIDGETESRAEFRRFKVPEKALPTIADEKANRTRSLAGAVARKGLEVKHISASLSIQDQRDVDPPEVRAVNLAVTHGSINSSGTLSVGGSGDGKRLLRAQAESGMNSGRPERSHRAGGGRSSVPERRYCPRLPSSRYRL
ncbi:MAG TPA: hypothetical protein VLS27_17710 [Gammaproteobacteria bacterium]|nr:hypothetical protein [Gammaproteobacteria bacterium]